MVVSELLLTVECITRRYLRIRIAKGKYYAFLVHRFYRISIPFPHTPINTSAFLITPARVLRSSL